MLGAHAMAGGGAFEPKVPEFRMHKTVKACWGIELLDLYLTSSEPQTVSLP